MEDRERLDDERILADLLEPVSPSLLLIIRLPLQLSVALGRKRLQEGVFLLKTADLGILAALIDLLLLEGLQVKTLERLSPKADQPVPVLLEESQQRIFQYPFPAPPLNLSNR